jgi:hypothetical protein
LARVPQGPIVARKPRSALVGATLPSLVPTVLLCGISSRIDHRMDGWDLVVETGHVDFVHSGLHVASAIRPSWLVSFPDDGLRRLGRIGEETLAVIRGRIVAALGGKVP